MTNIEPGRTGAKRQSFRTPSPRALLEELIREHPKADEQALLAYFREAVIDNEEYILVIIEYWFANNYRAVTDPTLTEIKDSKRSQKRRDEDRRKTAELAEAIRERIKDISLLEMLMVNGKKLADCTGRECLAMGPAVGVWLTRVGQALKPDQVVGKQLTEEQVKELY